jgi:XTP/dITP diphosphohydrolase
MELRLYVASGNAKKQKEMAGLLAGEPVVLLGPSAELPMPEVVEDGATFEENAEKKARETSAALRARGRTDVWVLADDSGLEVDALGGHPGVRSARFAEDRAQKPTDADNNAKLLDLLRGVPPERRTARFVCVLALCDPSGVVRLRVRGTVEGRILEEFRGLGGFGYDPLFVYRDGRTMAEMGETVKGRVSHRGEAMAMLRGALREYLVRLEKAE